MADHEPTRKGHNAHVMETGVETQNVTEIHLPEGRLLLLICPECHFIETHCMHQQNSWNADETQLTCDLCGIDGT